MNHGHQRQNGPLMSSWTPDDEDEDDEEPSTSAAGGSLEVLKDEVVQLIETFPNGVEVSRLTIMYRRFYGKRFGPLSGYGLSGLQELLDQIRDQVYVERIYNKNLIRSVNSPRNRRGHGANMDDAPKKAICQKVVKTVKKHPHGIPLNKLAEVFAFRFKQTLSLEELGFSSMEAFVASLSKDLLVEDGVVFHKKTKLLTGEDFDKKCREIVDLVKSYPQGIPLAQIASFYHTAYGKNLRKKELGFSSLADFIHSLTQELYVENEQIYYKSADPEAAAPKAPLHIDGVFKDVIELVEDHPEGVPIRKLSNFFSQRYRRNLTVSDVGFESVADFIDFLSDELLVEKEKIFHKKHRNASANPTTHASPAPVTKKCPVVLFGADSAGDVEIKQEDLMDKVKEVIKKCPAASCSIAELQKGYRLLFGSELPLKQYMALYDNHTAKQASSTRLDSRHVGAKCTEKPPETISKDEKKPLSVVVNEQVVRSKAGSPLLQFPGGMATPGNLSASDFPLFGSKPSKADKLRLKEGRGPVFSETYYSQVREVHGANMRAMEALLDNEENAGKRRKNMSANDVNCLIEDVLRALATEGEHVTIERVIGRVCSLLQVCSLRDMNIDPRRHLPALQDLQRTLKEINLYIESVEAVSSVCTLYELGQALANLKNKKRFEELHLGPLCKLPLIHRMFRIDANTKDDDVHQISTVDILRSLRMYRRINKVPRVDLAEFLKHLADQYSCESPYELGIRIQSLGLPISTLNKASAADYLLMEKAKETIQKEIQEEVEAKMYKIKKSLLDPAQGPMIFSHIGNAELRKKYASMTATDAVLEVFINSEGVFSKSMTKTIQTFLSCINRDRLARALFQLAICCGSLDAPQDLVAKEKPQKKAEKKTEETPAEMLPTEDDVKRFFQESVCNSKSTLTLVHLRTLEKRIAEHFRFRDFSQLQQGTFLDFIIKNKKVLQEAAGGAVCIDNQDPGLSGFRPCRQDVFEFIKQCGDGDDSRLAFIEAALRNHYRIRDSRELGHGPLSFLLNLTQRQKELSGHVLASAVRYECPLLPINTGVCASEPAVGLLGEVGRDQAMAALLSAPLLQDLQDWTQWQLVFLPNHGPLKDFIDKYCGKTELLALEVSPGVLLRVTSETGDKHFSDAAQALDPLRTAGHLVSMAVADGIPNTPTALLANHMESALNVGVAQEEISPGDDGYSYSTVARFVLECVTLIPTRICKELLQQVFLEPLSKVLGQAKSKAVLLEAAQTNTRYLNKLHQMGLLLGITEWRADFNKKLLQSPAAAADAVLQEKKVVLEDSMSDLSSVQSLNDVENEEETALSTSSSRANQQDSEDEDADEDDDEDDDEEQMYKLVSEDEDTDSSEEDQEEPSDEPQEEEKEEEEEEEKPNPQRAVIEDIRKTEFGIGVELNQEGQILMEKQQARLGRSLQRLSDELYSKDTHFVLELIQNADDNSYPDGGEQPALTFVVEKSCITILNNECGFEEKNIRAICDVGRSTKGKHKYGYIGQKGIGFKSVFKVTDCPEIHSNGFHIQFDKTSGPMGYILPHWLEQERPVNPAAKEIAEKRWTTKIHLPLRTENYQTKNLFHDVHPSLLLFLHRLRSITIFNEAEKRLVSMTRRDLSHNILEVSHTGGEERWLVLKKMLFPKKIKDDVESTELALAFQIHSSSCADVKPQKQPVFAFLPLRSFGFRFIIQGDFDIPSSREDVDRDSSWNQWLRSEIPQLFVQAMDVFSKHPEFSGLSGLCYFLQFIPQPSEILDFFNPVANQIIQLLRGRACLPAQEDHEGRVEFRQPSQLAVCPDRLIQQVIGGQDLSRSLSLWYLHPDLQCSVSGSLLSALGVHRLRAAEILTVTCCMARELLQHTQTHTDGELEKLARLLVCIFRALESEYEVDALLQSVRDVPMIPLADGSVVSLSSEGVFFPLDDVTQAHADLQALYQDLNTVDRRLLQSLDALGNSQVRELLRRLDVHELEPQQVLHQHIYPQLRSGDWQKKPQGIVVSYLVFIKLHAQDQEIRSLAAHVPVLTNQGFCCPAEHRIHFSRDYKNIHLPSVLPGVQWLLLDSCYLRADADVSGWRSVFTALGVRDLLIFRKEKRTLTTAQLSCSLWATESALWPTPADGQYTIMDHQCSELHTLLTTDQLSDQEKLQQRRALIQLLDNNWNSGERYGQLVSAQLLDADGGVVRNVRSSFIQMLTEFSWIPTHRPMCSTVSYLQPRSVYILSTAVNRLLGAHVDYMHSEQTASEFTSAIGLRHSVCVEDMVGYLKRWCVKESEEPSDEPEGADFSSTIDHIHALYCYLFNECSSGQLRDLFQRWPAVYIEYNRDGDRSSGRFYHLKEVCWCDPTGMFQRYRELIRRSDSGVQEPRVLAPLYSTLQDMKSMFETLSVEPNPSMKQYVCLLEAVCESAPLATGDVLQDVSIIFAKLADKCRVCVHGEQEQLNQTYCSSLREMVSHKRVFPTKTSGWVTLSRKPMISDNAHLEKIFKSHTSVCLLNLPSAAKKTANKYKRDGKHDKEAFSERDRELFLQICGIERLSQRVTTEPQTESYRPCPAVQTLVRQLVPFIQRFILHHSDFEEAYEELKDSGIAQRISALSFGQVGKLYIHYRLELPDESPIFESEDIICLLKDQKELYIHKDHLAARLDICRELVKLFTADKMFAKELERFLQGLVTCINDGSALKRFLDRENAQKLPENEEAWDVPAPVEVKAEPVVVRPSASAQQDVVQPEQNKEDRLVCWPPRASLHRTGGGSSVSGSQAVDEVMKIWPPPPPPAAQCDSGSEFSSSSSSLHPHTADPPAEVKVQQERKIKSSAAPHTERREEVSAQDVQSVVSRQKPAAPNTDPDEEQSQKTEEEISVTQTTEEEKQNYTAADQHTHQHSAPQVPAAAPELVLSQFQGAESVQRPSLTLDSAVWNRTVCPKEVLEDLPLNFSLPETLLLPGDGQMTEDAASIGQWGEQLVFSFLQHWHRSGSGPSEITWFNQSGESGRACDFKLSFSDQEILVEVKTTVRRDRHFIRMSANELDLALKEKERYHIYRVYGAGDAQHVRLCRIRNLAQHLHSKSLELFLFV